jgi:hypothetical protein
VHVQTVNPGRGARANPDYAAVMRAVCGLRRRQPAFRSMLEPSTDDPPLAVSHTRLGAFDYNLDPRDGMVRATGPWLGVVRAASPEFAGIQEFVAASITGLPADSVPRVIGVKRIVNPARWQQYEAYALGLAGAGASTAEFMLWHGTGDSNVDYIALGGVDGSGLSRKYAGRANVMGKAIYVAQNLLYSSGEFGHPVANQPGFVDVAVLLCRVRPGRPQALSWRNSRQAHRAAPDAGYNSVASTSFFPCDFLGMGGEVETRMWVLYDDGAVYPAYCVTLRMRTQ